MLLLTHCPFCMKDMKIKLIGSCTKSSISFGTTTANLILVSLAEFQRASLGGKRLTRFLWQPSICSVLGKYLVNWTTVYAENITPILCAETDWCYLLTLAWEFVENYWPCRTCLFILFGINSPLWYSVKLEHLKTLRFNISEFKLSRYWNFSY